MTVRWVETAIHPLCENEHLICNRPYNRFLQSDITQTQELRQMERPTKQTSDFKWPNQGFWANRPMRFLHQLASLCLDMGWNTKTLTRREDSGLPALVGIPWLVILCTYHLINSSATLNITDTLNINLYLLAKTGLPFPTSTLWWHEIWISFFISLS